MSINSHLENISKEAYISKEEKLSINTSIETLQRRLKLYFSDDLKIHFKFGSYVRGTILPRSKDRFSDVDYMVVFNDDGKKPQTYLDRLRRFAENYYSRSEIYQSNPTIVLELNHIKFDLVPAIEYYSFLEYYKIPAKASSYSDWISTNPSDFYNVLVEKNKSNKYQIKPLIRVMKYWNALNGYPFESFDLEKKIVNKNYWSYSNYILKDYFFDFTISLSDYEFNVSYKNEKIRYLKNKVKNIKNLEKQYPLLAENELNKLLPL